jgi:hypothetical protein
MFLISFLYLAGIGSSRISPSTLMEFMRWIRFQLSWWHAGSCRHGETNQFLKAFNVRMTQLLLLSMWQKRLKVILKPPEAIENVTRSPLVGKDLKKGGLNSTMMDLK